MLAYSSCIPGRGSPYFTFFDLTTGKEITIFDDFKEDGYRRTLLYLDWVEKKNAYVAVYNRSNSSNNPMISRSLPTCIEIYLISIPLNNDNTPFSLSLTPQLINTLQTNNLVSITDFTTGHLAMENTL